jgi:hypothetical protein
MKLACPMQHRGKYQSKILMTVLNLKALIPRCREDEVFVARMIPVMMLCIVIFAERQAQIFRLLVQNLLVKLFYVSLFTSFNK